MVIKKQTNQIFYPSRVVFEVRLYGYHQFCFLCEFDWCKRNILYL